MRTEQQIRNELKYYTKDAEPSAVGIRIATLLEQWGGLHHFEDTMFKKTDWTNPRYISLKLNSRMSTGQLSTFDFDALTRLVFLAHDYCIRIQLSPCNGSHFALMFHPRHKREGCMSERHPTIEQAVADWRERNPIPSPEMMTEHDDLTDDLMEVLS
jgi:hypothetical protein